MNNNKKKKNKQKTIYIDAGSSVADMSGLYRNNSFGSRKTSGGRSRFRECFRTYIEAVKMMIKPMLITMAIITIAFLIIYLIL